MITSEAVRAPLPTSFGVFDVHAFEDSCGHIYVALVHGDLDDGRDVLVRLHSECLTGDVLGSLRCDCGIQLRLAMRMIAAAPSGVLIYATGHEGRGIGLINKLRAYVAQDEGADTVDANVLLGLPVDSRDYTDAAGVLARLGVRTIRLLTNNPRKVAGLRAAGAIVDAVVPLPTAPHHRNLGYLRTKAERLGHLCPTIPADGMTAMQLPADAMGLLGTVRARPDRPYVALKYAQSLDGRIATATGDSKWISGEPERRVAHALRAACDAVLVGAGTAVRDDPELTVRLVSGASPTRVVLDSTLRVPLSAKLFAPEAATLVVTTERADVNRREQLGRQGVRVEVVPDDEGRVDLRAALTRLRGLGMESVLVEGGARVITGLLARGLVDRVIVAVAPIVIGAGTEAVDNLDITLVSEGIHLVDRTIVPVGDDVLLAWDVVAPPRTSLTRSVLWNRPDRADSTGQNAGVTAFRVAPVVAALATDGYAIVEGVLGDDQMAAMKAELSVVLDATPTGRNEFEGFATRRIYRLFGKTRVFDEWAIHPVVLGVLDAVLGPCQLSAPTGIQIGPGEPAQVLHRDDSIYPLPNPHAEVVLNTMWAFDDFTVENGATRIVTGSHRWDRDRKPGPDDPIVNAEMPAGSVVFYVGSLLHGGGANRTDAPRLGVILEYVAGWLRPQENHVIGVPPELVATLPERLQELLGYNIYPPFVGYVDGRHPRRFLPTP